MLLIGSHALLKMGVALGREPADTDVIATPDQLSRLVAGLREERELRSVVPANAGRKSIIRTNSLGVIEVEVAWHGTTAADLLVRGGTSATILCGRFDVTVAPLDTLYALKMSHRYLKNSPHFNKTRTDILIMRRSGAVIPDYLKDWFKRREAETYTYSHPKLNQSKAGFFSNDAIPYTYDHDSLHVSMAVGGVPAYTLYQKAGADVQSDRSKWEAIPATKKLDAVVEEACVLALERSQIPHPGVLTPEASFRLALQKVCTSITSGWFREYAWEHYDEVLAHFVTYRFGYLETFRAALAAGVVKSYAVAAV